jgi:hypothetical protein
VVAVLAALGDLSVVGGVHGGTPSEFEVHHCDASTIYRNVSEC